MPQSQKTSVAQASIRKIDQVLTPEDDDAMLLSEVSVSINTTAAGGNASLMAVA